MCKCAEIIKQKIRRDFPGAELCDIVPTITYYFETEKDQRIPGNAGYAPNVCPLCGEKIDWKARNEYIKKRDGIPAIKLR